MKLVFFFYVHCYHHALSLLLWYSGFSSILSIILNSSSGFHDVVPVTSMNEFFHSNAWLGAASALAGVAGGQIAALFADR